MYEGHSKVTNGCLLLIVQLLDYIKSTA